MRYYQALEQQLDLTAALVQLKVRPTDLLRNCPLSREQIDQQIHYQTLRRAGKLARKSPWPQVLLAVYKWLYRLQFRAYFHFASNAYSRLKPGCICLWNGHRLREKAALAAARHLNIPVLIFENGYLPNTTSIDPQGVNSACSIPRAADFYRRHQALAAAPIQTLDVREPIKAKAQQSCDASAPELDGKYIFVPFQVDLDSQLLINSPQLKNMRDFFALIEALALANPAWRFIVKEHPSCNLNYQDLHQRQPNIQFSQANTEQLIRNAQAIVTINSSVGMEAIIFHKPVITLGEAFYNIPGLCLQAGNQAKIQQQLEIICNQHWTPDPQLIQSFISFLQNQYLVPIAWRRADKFHFAALSARIRKFIKAPHCPIWEG